MSILLDFLVTSYTVPRYRYPSITKIESQLETIEAKGKEIEAALALLKCTTS
ncbi:MAG: hypothetical protein H8E17_00475 [Deltaproteobacteria bacterium]|nr:hypothetical protein [Deltaproteobacteria bacterium]